ncbi:hypothetical protein PSHT_08802 [Puccinia striiformis]|uniref:Uncharacterized protein n=1 Tax=Puccinia striiformis TaxID=27350 RepID=A0A2S4VLH1_9BASI|nr:hypothetical protein PSHT_08802 [Puccinia striiformis]
MDLDTEGEREKEPAAQTKQQLITLAIHHTHNDDHDEDQLARFISLPEPVHHRYPPSSPTRTSIENNRNNNSSNNRPASPSTSLQRMPTEPPLARLAPSRSLQEHDTATVSNDFDSEIARQVEVIRKERQSRRIEHLHESIDSTTHNNLTYEPPLNPSSTQLNNRDDYLPL